MQDLSEKIAWSGQLRKLGVHQISWLAQGQMTKAIVPELLTHVLNCARSDILPQLLIGSSRLAGRGRKCYFYYYYCF